MNLAETEKLLMYSSQVRIQQLGPGMMQQIQSMCGECHGEGERVDPKLRLVFLLNCFHTTSSRSFDLLNSMIHCEDSWVRGQLSVISCQIGQLSDRTTFRSDNCQIGQLSDRTTVSGDNCQWRQLSVETTVSGDNCQWGQLSVGQLSVETVSAFLALRQL